jgi:hypothetical protein
LTLQIEYFLRAPIKIPGQQLSWGMDPQSERYFKALTPLYRIISMPFAEFRSYLERELGQDWVKTYNELNEKGFFHLNQPITGISARLPGEYSITNIGNAFYESCLVQRKGDIGLKKYNRILFLVVGFAIGVLVMREYFSSSDSYSNGMDPRTVKKISRPVDSMIRAYNYADSLRQIDSLTQSLNDSKKRSGKAKYKSAKITIVKDCCTAEDSMEPKPPEVK